MITAEVAQVIAVLNTKIPVMNLRHLKQTQSGLLAVYTDPTTALDVARRLRTRRPAPGMRVRYALYWGDVSVAGNGIPWGHEGDVLHSILYLANEDRIIATDAGELPESDRVLMPSGAVAQLHPDLRQQFVCLGSYRVAGCSGALEIWIERPENADRHN